MQILKLKKCWYLNNVEFDQFLKESGYIACITKKRKRNI